MTRYSIDNIRLELQAPTEGFVIGHSNVGSALGDSDDVLQWLPYTCDTRDIHVTRGGQRDGAATSLDVGTLTATFVNAGDPLEDYWVRPNTPLRAVHDGVNTLRLWDFIDGAVPLTTATNEYGELQQFYVSRSVTPGSGDHGVTDGILWIQSTTSPRLNFRSDFTPGETYRLRARVRTNKVGGVTASFYSGFSVSDPLSVGTDWTELVYEFTSTSLGSVANRLDFVTGGTSRTEVDWLRVERGDPQTPIFTGTVQDVATSYDREGNTFVTIVGADAVQAHANTQRYGAQVEGGVGHESWVKRVQRLMTSSRVPYDSPDLGTGRSLYASFFRNGVDGWQTFGSYGSNPIVRAPLSAQYATGSGGTKALYVSSTTPGGAINVAALATGIQRTITGLVPGETYEAVVTLATNYSTMAEESPLGQYAVGMVGKSWGQTVQLGNAGTRNEVRYPFTATSESHSLRVARSAAFNSTYGAGGFEALMVLDAAVYATDDEFSFRAFEMQDIVYESTLQNHLDLACDSVGAAWYVDKRNVTRFLFLGDGADTVAHFSDEHSEDDPLHVCYTNVERAYDTRNVVNDLAMQQHGRNAETGDADDVTYPFKDITSVATWGSRAGNVDTSIYDEGTWAGSVAKRAAQILHSNATPEVIVSRVTFNAFDYLDLLVNLDVYSRIQVTHKGITSTHRVATIGHDVTPDKWLVTLDLVKDI